MLPNIHLIAIKMQKRQVLHLRVHRVWPCQSSGTTNALLFQAAKMILLLSEGIMIEHEINEQTKYCKTTVKSGQSRLSFGFRHSQQRLSSQLVITRAVIRRFQLILKMTLLQRLCLEIFWLGYWKKSIRKNEFWEKPCKSRKRDDILQKDWILW